MERRRRLQLRRRLLCQVHQALAAERAADLECPALRLRAGERDSRSAHAHSRLQRRQQTENTRAAYPVDFIENAVIPGHRRASEKRSVPHRRCVRRAASHLKTVAGAGHVSLPLGLHGQGCGNRSWSQGTFGNVLHLLRIPIHSAPAQDLCRNAGAPAARAQRAMLAG